MESKNLNDILFALLESKISDEKLAALLVSRRAEPVQKGRSALYSKTSRLEKKFEEIIRHYVREKTLLEEAWNSYADAWNSSDFESNVDRALQIIDEI